MGGARVVDCLLSDTGGGQWVIVGGEGGRVVRLCCGGGWQLWGVCRNAELVIVGIYGHV